MAGALRLAGVLLVVIVAIGAPLAVWADQPESLEETLGGFDDEDDPTSGFDDEEDPYAGFDDDQGLPGPTLDDAERFWDLAGDLSLGTSYSYLTHSSATGTPYGNLSRLRAQLDLQLDEHNNAFRRAARKTRADGRSRL